MTTQALVTRHPSDDKPERLDNATWYSPAADIMEDRDGFTLKLDMPGVRPADVDITYDDGVLSVEGKTPDSKRADDRHYLVHEYDIGPYRRSFSIRTPVDADGIEGHLKDGELSIRVPKAAEAKARKIAVRDN